MNQEKYASTLLEKFGLKDCKPVSIPLAVNGKMKKDDQSEYADEAVYREIVRSLLYVTAKGPNIMFAASLLSRFTHNPTKKHF